MIHKQTAPFPPHILNFNILEMSRRFSGICQEFHKITAAGTHIQPAPRHTKGEVITLSSKKKNSQNLNKQNNSQSNNQSGSQNSRSDSSSNQSSRGGSSQN